MTLNGLVIDFVVLLVGTTLVPEITSRVYRINPSDEWVREEKPHKQTYLEYVIERLAVERMLK